MQTNAFRPKFDAAQVYRSFLEELKKQLFPIELVLNEQNKHEIGQIALWYSNDERFKGDLRKGLLIRGGVGTGKTKIVMALMKVIEIGENRMSKFIHARDLQDLYMRQNVEEIDILKQRKTTIIDDLGVENVEAKFYGNTVEPFNDLFDYRYRHGMQTIITTNLVPSEIKLMYGDRIADRMREVMNDIVLDYNSLRK
jgi:DNA replication protein DnaC